MIETELVDYLEGHPGVEMGRHSKIPDCCILFWVTVYMPSISQKRIKSPYYPSRMNNGFDYIPCNNCLEKGNKVKMHCCTSRCNKWLRSKGFNPERMNHSLINRKRR